MAIGSTTKQSLNQFIGNLLIKHNGKTPDKELAKLIKAEFTNLNRDAEQLLRVINTARGKLNRGKLSYSVLTVEEKTFDQPSKAIAQFGAKEVVKAAPKKEKTVTATKPATKTEKVAKKTTAAAPSKPKIKMVIKKKV